MHLQGISLLSMVGKIYVRVVCDRLRLLTGAVLVDKQQGGYRVRRPNLGTEASFRFIREAVSHLC